MKTELERLSNSEVKVTVTVPTEKVDEAFQKALTEIAENTELKGFRKGKAPLGEVEKQLDQGELNGRVVNLLIPEAYTAAIKKENLKPIADPRIEIKKFARGNEFVFEVRTAEMPEVALGDWRGALKGLAGKAQIATAATITDAKNKAEEKGNQKKVNLPKLLEALTNTAKVELPGILVEDEVSRMLTRLNDRLATLGLSPQEYLKNRGQSKEGLQQESAQEAKKLLKTEFVLAKLAEELSIEIKEEEIAEAIEATPDEAAKKSLNTPESRAYIKAIIRKNKTVEELLKITGSSR